MSLPDNFHFTSIGHIESPYREKFGIPRQPGLVTAAESRVVLAGNCNREEICRGLEGFSHIWIIFVFHEAMRDQWKPMVRPPRLGGNNKVGVFASRSPFRPNPIGLSVAPLTKIERCGDQWRIGFIGGDLLHGTPVLDIKPYIPYADSVAEARGGFATEAPVLQDVTFTPDALISTQRLSVEHPNLELLIKQVIAQQPQPAYQTGQQERTYGITLYDVNVRWRNEGGTSVVIEVSSSRKAI